MSPFDFLAMMLVAVAAIGWLNRLFVRLPPAIGLLGGSLLLAAAVLAADPLTGGAAADWLRGAFARFDLPDLFLEGILGLLLFAATFQVSLSELAENKRIIFLLATASVILSTVLFGVGLYGACLLVGYEMPLRWCLVIGAILAPTDAVVVDDLLRRVRMPASLRGAIAGESLLNDGAGIVMFVIMLHLAAGERGLFGHGRVVLAIAKAGGGGALLGLALGLLARRAVRAVRDDGLVLIVTLAVVLVSYRVADLIEVSGPIAVVAAGLAFGGGARNDQGRTQDPHRHGHPHVVTFWLLLHELLNALLFLLIGLQAVEIAFRQIAWLPVLCAIPLAVLARLVSTAIPVAFLGGGWTVRARRVAVLTWAGMRGGVSIAMVLATPATPWRGELLAICLAVVLFTVFAQGLSMPWALRRLYREA
ncbi:cation:proton antiporter [Rhodopila sp.]|uniref:cation:proton antiporter n=1 Tax=Rhodopila sp. TaxID=2480087 RepID=UPI002B681F38|nr:cation:proton antiporter [Rhodopila sp.]HVZ10088.1 cation:proton antiporter [Rhodopila sp.]